MQQLIPVFQCFEPLLTDKFTLYQIVGLHVYRGNYGVLKVFFARICVWGLKMGQPLPPSPRKGYIVLVLG
jgi:hypothetical protein